MTTEQLRIAVAELRGWVWYRIPKLPSDSRGLRMLALPSIQEYEGQSEQWKIRADGSETQCSLDYMEREAHVPKLDYNDLAIARQELLTSPELIRKFVESAWSNLTASMVLDDYEEYGFMNMPPEHQAIALCKVFGKEIK